MFSCYKCFTDETALLDHIPKHKDSKHLKASCAKEKVRHNLIFYNLKKKFLTYKLELELTNKINKKILKFKKIFY